MALSDHSHLDMQLELASSVPCYFNFDVCTFVKQKADNRLVLMEGCCKQRSPSRIRLGHGRIEDRGPSGSEIDSEVIGRKLISLPIVIQITLIEFNGDVRSSARYRT
jgi:hypothetical protein